MAQTALWWAPIVPAVPRCSAFSSPDMSIQCAHDATTQVITGCRHEHIESFAFCSGCAEALLAMGGAAACIRCAVQPRYAAMIDGIPIEAGPHACPLYAGLDPRGLQLPPAPPEPTDWQMLGWTDDGFTFR